MRATAPANARMSAAWLAQAAAMLVFGCAEPEATTAIWPAVSEDELVFLALVDGGGLLKSHGPFRFEDPTSASDPLVVRELLGAGASLVHLAISASAIAGVVPGFRPEAATAVQLGWRSSPCQVLVEGTSHFVSLEAVGARVRRLEGDRFVEDTTPRSELRLIVQPNHAECFPGHAPSLAPFGATRELLPLGAVLRGTPLEALDGRGHLRWGVALSLDFVIAGSSGGVFVFERGQPWRDDARRFWSQAALPARPWQGYWLLDSLEVDFERSGADRARLLGTAVWTEPSEVKRSSVVFTLDWTPDGFGEPRILFEEQGTHLRHVYPQPNGRYTAVGDDGLMVTGDDLGGEAQRLRDVGVNQGAPLRRVEVGPSDDEPLALLDSRHSLYFGSTSSAGAAFRRESPSSAVRGAEQLVAVRLPGGEKYYFWDTIVSEVWVRRATGARDVFEYEIPTAFQSCTASRDECGGLEFIADRTALAAGPSNDSLILVPGACSAVLEVDPVARCSRAILLEGLAPRDQPRATYRSARVRDGVLTVTGPNGTVLQARW